MNAAYALIFDFLVHIILYFQKLRFLTSAFNRPGFPAIMDAIEAREADCVIVKDECVILELNTESPQRCGFYRHMRQAS